MSTEFLEQKAENTIILNKSQFGSITHSCPVISMLSLNAESKELTGNTPVIGVNNGESLGVMRCFDHNHDGKDEIKFNRI